MALASKGFTIGFIAGFGVGFITRSLAENPREKLMPALKASMKVGVRVTERAREMFAHLGEMMQDAIAEVRADLKEGAKVRSGHPPSEGREEKTKDRKSRKGPESKVSSGRPSELKGSAKEAPLEPGVVSGDNVISIQEARGE